MTSTELRQSFLDFFAAKNHTIVPSASLMPSSPNLLFNNAGMNQFVPYFLGERKAPYKRAADTQKCIRAGGKHNDLEDVGFDTYHHTFFEMLGNWSFGDYFKEEALTWSWELLTKVWKLPKERIYATVYQPEDGGPGEFDEEAWNIWKRIFESEGLDPAIHIKKTSECFWQMGETGPCGPCSEIHLDATEKGDTQGSLVDGDSPYCMELWNNVFIQLNAKEDGSFEPLTERHVDTGMGFERVSGIMATTKNFTEFKTAPSNYASDLFTGIFQTITDLCGKEYKGTIPGSRENQSEQETIDISFRVLADHARTVTVAIADGILPGNEGRNYVIRRILRRGILYGKKIGLEIGFFEKLITPVIEKLGPIFPEIKEQESIIHRIIRSEEEAFGRTLDRGLQLFEKAANNGVKLSGKDAFTLYDTYGFPLDLTQLLATERGLAIDLVTFNTLMEEQRQRARASQKKTAISVSTDEDNSSATLFTGYTLKTNPVETTIVDFISSGKDHFIVFSETPFYAEMGGQTGDSGTVTIDSKRFRITDTLQDKNNRFLHKIICQEGSEISELKTDDLRGKTATLQLDTDRRRSIQRHHTATHLLNYALRKVLGTHVQQAGSLVTDNRLRFDFSHFESIKEDELQRIENIINSCILDNATVKTFETDFDKKPDNCLAFFGEKYGNKVRVVDIGDYSVELCGGTHVSTTGEIGLTKIVSESGIAAGTRRIEAVAGDAAIEWIDGIHEKVKYVSQKLGASISNLEKKLDQFLEQKAQAEKSLKGIQQKESANLSAELAQKAELRDGITHVIAKVSVENPGELRALGNQVLSKLDNGVVILGASIDGKASIVAFCSAKAISAGIRAGDLIKSIAPQLDGTGGGKPDFAMGGGKSPEKLETVLSNI
ncbi:MAG: alanine--tRNA ligase [Opitutaceae bacterium]|nr:alanine--tRNA ligase [Opitutaceae bacterium]